MIAAIAGRFAMLLLVVWMAASVHVLIPRLADRNPVAERLAQVAAQGGSQSGIDEMVKSYEARVGLDRPLWQQYLGYLGDLARFDLGYSIANDPMRVADQIALALPWTIGLLGAATLVAFAVGSILGAPARQIRAQALVLRGAPYVVMARLGGMRGPEIVLREMLPNLLPFLMASFVLALAQAILASVGLEALGLGAQDEPTLGMTVYWMMSYSAFVRGFWWWIAAPIVALCLVFVALYLVTAGLDEIANPRLKRRVVA